MKKWKWKCKPCFSHSSLTAIATWAWCFASKDTYQKISEVQASRGLQHNQSTDNTQRTDFHWLLCLLKGIKQHNNRSGYPQQDDTMVPGQDSGSRCRTWREFPQSIISMTNVRRDAHGWARQETHEQLQQNNTPGRRSKDNKTTAQMTHKPKRIILKFLKQTLTETTIWTFNREYDY